MIEGVPLGLNEIGPWGLLTLVVALLVMGLYKRKLVPEKDLLDEQARSARWQQAYEMECEAHRKDNKSFDLILRALDSSSAKDDLILTALNGIRERADGE